MIGLTDIPNISFDIQKAKRKMRPYLMAAMDRSADELLKYMKQFATEKTIVGRTGKGGPGDPTWREELGNDVRRLFEHITDDLLEYGVGVDYHEEYMKVRANIIDLGSGNQAGNERIHAGPPGREVWNDALTERNPSKSPEYDLPEGFNHPGNDYVVKALDAVEPFINNAIEHALDGAPADLLADCLIIS